MKLYATGLVAASENRTAITRETKYASEYRRRKVWRLPAGGSSNRLLLFPIPCHRNANIGVVIHLWMRVMLTTAELYRIDPSTKTARPLVDGHALGIAGSHFSARSRTQANLTPALSN